MKSTQLPFSNEKQRVELPTTTALYPTGTTINNAGKPLVFHPQAGKMSIGEFPTPDGSYLRYRTITAGQVQDIYTDPDTPSFLPGWVYAVEGQNPGLIIMQAVGARSLDVKNAWQVKQVPQQFGGTEEVANPVFYNVDTDTITPRVIDDSNYAKLDRRNDFQNCQVIREPNVAGETTIGGTFIEIRADNSSSGYGKLRVAGVDNQGLIESALILDSLHVQVAQDPVLDKDVVNKGYLVTQLSGVTIDQSNLVHKTGNESIAGVKTFTTSLIALGDTDPNGLTAPFILRAANKTNQIGATMILDAELIGGKKFTFGAIGSQVPGNVGSFVLFNATDGAYMFSVSSTGAGKFYSSVDAPTYFVAGNQVITYGNDQYGTGNQTMGIPGTGYNSRWNTGHVAQFIGDYWSFICQGTGANVTIDNYGNLTGVSTLTAGFLKGDGSQITNLPVATPNGGYGVVKTNSGPITLDSNGVLVLKYEGGGLAYDDDYNRLVIDHAISIDDTDQYRMVNAPLVKQYVDTKIAALQGTSTRVADAPVYTVTTAGAQTVPLGATATLLSQVQILEAATGKTRNAWKPNCTISGQNVQITTDAALKNGDKILITYFY